MKLETIIAIAVTAILTVCLMNLQWFNLSGKPSQPMPTPQVTPDSKNSSVIQARRLEILDANGKVSIIFDTANGGSPIAIVNDNGRAITIDLVKVARYAK